jgi:hypothetical protein
MLRLYTDRASFKNSEILYDNDAVFEVHTSRLKLSETDKEFMMKYDEAKIIGENERLGIPVQTRYGVTHINNLSTGLKTLLNLRHMRTLPQYKAIDITEAGENVLLDIFEQATALDVPVILGHTFIPKFKHLQIQVDDGEIVTDESSLQQIIWTKGDAD